MHISEPDKNLLITFKETFESVFGKFYHLIFFILISEFLTLKIVMNGVQISSFVTIPFQINLVIIGIIVFSLFLTFLEVHSSNRKENYVGFILGILLSFSIVFYDPSFLFDFPSSVFTLLLFNIEK